VRGSWAQQICGTRHSVSSGCAEWLVAWWCGGAQGESTINQLERVIEITGKPSKLDMKAIKSKYTTTMLDTINVKPQK
jgi:hypothetical protein